MAACWPPGGSAWDAVPAIRLGHLSEAQARAYRLADNQIALNSGWDEALLAAEIARIRDEAVVDLDVLGFDQATLDRLLAETGIALDDAAAAEAADQPAPEPPTEPVTRPGDLWLLGAHRLLCGDATDPGDVARLLAGAQPHLMITDPPYGVDYDPAWRNEVRTRSLRTGRVANDDRADWREAWALFPGDVAYVWHADVHTRTVIESLEAAGFAIRSQIIWAKPRLVLSRGDYHYQHEPCLYAVRKGATGHWQGARDQTTLWQIAMVGAEDDAETVHGTQKPLDCMRRPIVNNSAPGEAVYDPFLGSGTTLIAAELTGRVCVAMEIDPRYCDMTIERWQRVTGGAAVLAGERRAFADVAAVRRARAAA